MKSSRIITLLMALAIIVTVQSCSKKKQMEPPPVPTSFSAEVTSTTPKGTFSGMLNVSDAKARMTFPQSILITRQDLGKFWVLIPAQKAYLEHDLKPEYAFSVGGTFPGEISRELVATEDVGGVMAEKYKVTYILKNAAGDEQAKPHTVFQWIAKDLRIPMKTQAEDGSWSYSYSKVVTGPQPDNLFELDRGYVKLVMPVIETP